VLVSAAARWRTSGAEATTATTVAGGPAAPASTGTKSATSAWTASAARIEWRSALGSARREIAPLVEIAWLAARGCVALVVVARPALLERPARAIGAELARAIAELPRPIIKLAWPISEPRPIRAAIV
jgi:hypothetical protein